MTKAEAAYNLLLMLSAVDGTIDEVEREVIRAYSEQLSENPVDFSVVEKSLARSTPDELLRRFQQAALCYQDTATPEERVTLMLTGLEVVMADGTMTEDETAIFRGLADVWGLQYEAIVAHLNQARGMA